MGNIATPLERAFELARSGNYRNIEDIKSRLKKEGFQTDQVSGGSLLRQMRAMIKASGTTVVS
jgi:hypothetical protein